MANIEQAFDTAFKATEGQAQPTEPKGQPEAAPKPEATLPAGQAKITQEAPKEAPKSKEEGQAKREWDGKEETLSTELKQDPKAVQRYLTRLSTTKAELENKLKGYEGIDKAEVEAYRAWKQQQSNQVINTPPQPTQLTNEQWNLIKDDPAKVTAYVNSLVQAQLNDAAKVVYGDLQKIKYEQSVAQWEKTISDFGQAHPDLWDMHENGLFKPILDETLKQGGNFEDAYAKACLIRDSMYQARDSQIQNRVKEKKNASTLAPNTTSKEPDIVYVDDKRKTLDAAFNLALEGKKATVKYKK